MYFLFIALVTLGLPLLGGCFGAGLNDRIIQPTEGPPNWTDLEPSVPVCAPSSSVSWASGGKQRAKGDPQHTPLPQGPEQPGANTLYENWIGQTQSRSDLWHGTGPAVSQWDQYCHIGPQALKNNNTGGGGAAPVQEAYRLLQQLGP